MSVECKKVAFKGSMESCLQESLQPGELRLFWLGQAGFILQTARSLLLIDPYLSDALHEKYKNSRFKHQRMMQPPIDVQGISAGNEVDLLLATHAHSDHLDPGSVKLLFEASSSMQLICPRSCVGIAVERGADINRIRPLNPDEQVNFPDEISIMAIPAAHEDLAEDEIGNALYVGYMIALNGITIYHSGDCIPFPGLAKNWLRKYTVDVALLPVNGRDELRKQNGVPGNFYPGEAAALCKKANIPILIPHHFGMFSFNTVSIKSINEQLSDAGVRWLLPNDTSYIKLWKNP